MDSGIFGYISDLLGIPVFVPLLVFGILIIGLIGFILFVYKKISDINTTDSDNSKNNKK